MDKVKKIFSSPVASVIVVLVAILGRSIIQIHFASISGDKAFQVQAAQNFLEGHGLSLLQVFSGDLSQPHFIPLAKWPPGYSFFLMPFLLLCKSDFLLATILLDIITAILFIFFSRRLLSKFGVPVYWLNLYTLVSGFFIYEFCTASTSDFQTLTIFIAALLSAFSVIQSQQSKPRQLLVLAFLLFLTGFTRFMFIPVAFVIPVYFIASGYFSKDKLLIKKGFIVFVVLFLLMTLFVIIQKSYTGSATYIIATEKGFYPEHLLRFYPVGFSSIFNTNMVCVQLAKITGMNFLKVYQLLIGVHFCFFLILFYLFLKYAFNKNTQKNTLFDHYLFIGALSSGVILLLLAYLSLTNQLITIDWTFIQEGRYVAFLTFFLQQILFLAISLFSLVLRKSRKILIYILFGIVSLSSLHGIYFVIKTISTKIYSSNAATEQKVLAYSDSLISKVIKENNGQSFAIASQTSFVNAIAAFQQNVPELHDSISLYQNNIRAKKETVLILVRKRPMQEKNIFNAKLVGAIGDNYFYTVKINPDVK